MDWRIKDYYFRELSEAEVKKPIAELIGAFLAEIGLSVFGVFLSVHFNSVFLLVVMLVVSVFAALFLANCACSYKEKYNFSEGILFLDLMLPDKVRLYSQIVNVIIGRNCQYIGLNELRAATRTVTPERPMYYLNAEEFCEDVRYMCSQKWFRHGRVVGDMFCITDSAVEYLTGQIISREISGKEEEAFLKEEKAFVAKNLLPETYPDFKEHYTDADYKNYLDTERKLIEQGVLSKISDGLENN